MYLPSQYFAEEKAALMRDAVQEFCQEQNVQVPNFIGSVRESGLHAKDVVKLMAVLARFPPPVVSSVETMAAILRGPPRLSLYELREQVSATPDMRAAPM